ncbi:MAG: hypothetical protein EOP07_11175 [Proteobacteria bacterium]|nr:MAG: hypothetical protein EOP07_11175 [Pseudomonadota bacterium]
MKYSKSLVIVGVFSISGAVLAQDAKAPNSVLTHPFKVKSNGLSLNARADAELPMIEQAPDAIGEAGLSPRFHLRQKNFEPLSLTDDRKIESVSYGFDLDDVPVCDIEVKVHRTLDGFTAIMGELPQAPTNNKTLTDAAWATTDQVKKIVGETMLMASLGGQFTVESQDRCILSEGSKPVWKMTVALRFCTRAEFYLQLQSS